MTSIDAYAGAGGYELKSEMARVCLPAPEAQAQRVLAWTNSVCLFFLIVGVAGFRSAPPPLIAVKPLEEAAPVIIETLPPPPATVQTQPEDEPKEPEKADAPRVVVVTPDSPAINFSVPTIGSVVVPNAAAVAPPEAPVPRVAAARSQPSPLNNTGEGGDRPEPPYPKLAQDMGQHGSVVLMLTVDEAGVVISAEVKEPSGSSILDRATLEFVKKHWTVSPGARGRLYQATITYVFK
jgi:TonB family protein